MRYAKKRPLEILFSITGQWSTFSQVNELVKDLVRYSEELHKKHKQIKVMIKIQI